jgi:hypothetical protein
VTCEQQKLRGHKNIFAPCHRQKSPIPHYSKVLAWKRLKRLAHSLTVSDGLDWWLPIGNSFLNFTELARLNRVVQDARTPHY